MITRAKADQIIQVALETARARVEGTKPLAVIVLDAGGHPIAFSREDGASLYRFDISRAKAMGALGMGDDTRILAERAKANPAFFQSVSIAVGGQIAFSPGGVLVRDDTGQIIGAVGISGDAGEVDELCAQAGIRAAGFSCGAGA